MTFFRLRRVRESRVFGRKKFHRVRRYRELIYSTSATMGVQALLFVFLAVLTLQAWNLVRRRYVDASAVKYLLPAGIFALGLFFLIRAVANYKELQILRSEMLSAAGEDEAASRPPSTGGSGKQDS